MKYGERIPLTGVSTIRMATFDRSGFEPVHRALAERFAREVATRAGVPIERIRSFCKDEPCGRDAERIIEAALTVPGCRWLTERPEVLRSWAESPDPSSPHDRMRAKAKAATKDITT